MANDNLVIPTAIHENVRLALPRRTRLRRLASKSAQRVLAALGAALLLLVFLIAITLVRRTWPILAATGIGNLLAGNKWAPHNGLFGFAPFIAGSLYVTLGAMLIAVLPAILSGVYVAEYTSPRTRSIVKPMLDLLVGLPSVIFGLWGVLVIVPLLREYVGPAAASTGLSWLAFTNPSGYSVLAGALVLAIMVFPLIVAVVDEVLRSAPQEMREALLSLGATRWEATRVLIRRSTAGIIAAVVLGFSRAFGETLAVLMVVGNRPLIPHSLFDPAYPLTALIANNYGEMMSVPLYESALMSAALILFTAVLGFNMIARFFILRVQKGSGA